jgi:hypothetical protein
LKGKQTEATEKTNGRSGRNRGNGVKKETVNIIKVQTGLHWGRGGVEIGEIETDSYLRA